MLLNVSDYKLPHGTLPTSRDIPSASDQRDIEACKEFLLGQVREGQEYGGVRFVVVQVRERMMVWVISNYNAIRTPGMLPVVRLPKDEDDYVTVMRDGETPLLASLWDRVIAEAEEAHGPEVAANLRNLIDVRS